MADSDEGQGQGDPKPSNDNPPSGDNGQPGGDQANAGGQGDPNPQDTTALTKALDSERKARREADRKLKEIEGQVAQLSKEKQEREDAEKTELQKVQERAAALEREKAETENRLKAERTRTAVILSAGKLNVIDPDAAEKLLDTASITYDADGRPENVEELLKDLIKEKPYLVKADEKPGSGPPRTPKAGDQAELTEAQKKERSEQLQKSYARSF